MPSREPLEVKLVDGPAAGRVVHVVNASQPIFVTARAGADQWEWVYVLDPAETTAHVVDEIPAWALPTNPADASTKLERSLINDPEVTTLTVKQVEDALAALRARAAAWRTGMGAIFTAIFATYALSASTGGLNSYKSDWVWVLAVLVLLSIAFGVVSLHCLIRAANGPTTQYTRLRQLTRPVTVPRMLKQLSTAARDFRLGQTALYAAGTTFTATLVLSWAWAR